MQGISNVAVNFLVVDVRLLKQLQLAFEEILDGGGIFAEIDTFFSAGLGF